MKQRVFKLLLKAYWLKKIFERQRKTEALFPYDHDSF